MFWDGPAVRPYLEKRTRQRRMLRGAIFKIAAAQHPLVGRVLLHLLCAV
jgi:hypothetical protein